MSPFSSAAAGNAGVDDTPRGADVSCRGWRAYRDARGEVGAYRELEDGCAAPKGLPGVRVESARGANPIGEQKSP